MTDIFKTAIRNIFEIMNGLDDDFKTAIYQPNGGNPVTLTIHVRQETKIEPAGQEGQVFSLGTTVEALLEDLGKEPDRGETFTTGDAVYTVRNVFENNGRTIKAIVT